MSPKQAELLSGDFVDLGRSGPKVDGPEDIFASQCRSFALPAFERQLAFARAALGRGWKFDFAWRQFMLAVEIEGLVPKQTWEAKLDGKVPVSQNGHVVNVVKVDRLFVVLGRHASIGGIIEDMEKYNTAALLGWTVLRFPQKAVKPKHAIEMTMRVLAARGWKQHDG